MMSMSTWMVLGLCLLGTLATAAEAGDRGHYTEQRLAHMRHNVATYDWARQERDAIVQRADKWLQYDLDRLRTLVPLPEVPRSTVAHETGAPVDGASQISAGRYSWQISFDEPWKVKHPVTGAVYPSNDFQAYLDSGKGPDGRFDAARADRSLLTGPYADDGWGAKVEGHRHPFWFVAFYNEWLHTRFLLPAMEDLSKAYLLTGDARYARACALLLWQFAEYYPDYRYEEQSQYAKEVLPGYTGRVINAIWEAFYTGHVVPLAYDAIRPAIEADTQLQAYLRQDARQIRHHIEERMLRTMAQDIMGTSGRVMGNYGMHQVALLRVAAALSHTQGARPESRQMQRWVMDNPASHHYVSIGLDDAMENLIYPDGHPFESPSYNTIWMETLSHIVDHLGPQGQRYVDSPRFRRLYTWPMRMAVGGRMVPSYGDSNTMFHGALGWDPKLLLPAWRRWRDPMTAKALVQLDLPLKQDLFEEAVDRDTLVEAAKAHPDKLGMTSAHLPAVGYASLQAGDDSSRLGVAMLYGYYQSHSHYDRMQIDLYGYDHALTPDLGYPETANSVDPRRYTLFCNTLTHKTVVVDAKRQDPAHGALHVFDPGDFAQLLEVSAEDAYPGVTSLYRRTVMLVEVSPSQAYVVDVFRVRGGSQHDWFMHGTQAEFQSDLPLSPPRKGTLAGPEVDYGWAYDDERFQNHDPLKIPNYMYQGSGFQWLFNVQQAALSGTATVTWRLNRPAALPPRIDNQGVALRAHLVGESQQVHVADMKPQLRDTWPQTLKFVNRRRVADKTGQPGPLESVFVTVYEPHRHDTFIASVRALPAQTAGDDLPVALEVTLKDGRRHIVFSRLEHGATPGVSTLKLPDGHTLDARAAVLAYDAQGRPSAAYRMGQADRRSASAIVASVDYTAGHITLQQPAMQGWSRNEVVGGVALAHSQAHDVALPLAGELTDRRVTLADTDIYLGRIHIESIKAIEGQVPEKIELLHETDPHVIRTPYERVRDLQGAYELRFLPRFHNLMRAGLTLVNEKGQPVARLMRVEHGRLIVLPAVGKQRLTLADFPDVDRDGRRTARAAMVGPGDTLTLHRSSRALPARHAAESSASQ